MHRAGAVSQQSRDVVIRNTEFVPHEFPGESLWAIYVNGGERPPNVFPQYYAARLNVIRSTITRECL